MSIAVFSFEHMHGVADRRERIAQLMGQCGDEFVLSTVRFLQRGFGVVARGDVRVCACRSYRLAVIVPLDDPSARQNPAPGAVLVPEPMLAFVEIDAAFQMIGQNGSHRFAIVGMNEFLPGADMGFEFTCVVTQHRGPVAAELGLAAGNMPVPDAELLGFERQRELAAAVAQRLLRLLEIVDVGIAAEPFDDLPRRVAHRHGEGAKPAIGPVVAMYPKFGVELQASRGGGAPRVNHPLAVFGVHLLQPAVAELLRLAPARVAHPLGADIIAGAIRLTRPDELWKQFRNLAETALALSQGVLGRLPIRDVQIHSQRIRRFRRSRRELARPERGSSAIPHRGGGGGVC